MFGRRVCVVYGKRQAPDDLACTQGYHLLPEIIECEQEPNGEAACIDRQPDTGTGEVFCCHTRVTIGRFGYGEVFSDEDDG